MQNQYVKLNVVVVGNSNRTQERVQRSARKGEMPEHKDRNKRPRLSRRAEKTPSRRAENDGGEAAGGRRRDGSVLVAGAGRIAALGADHSPRLGPGPVEAEHVVHFPFCSICLRAKRGPIFCYYDDWQAIF